MLTVSSPQGKHTHLDTSARPNASRPTTTSRLQQDSGWRINIARIDLTHYQVEPQEKKKTPKGRAKKRLTYTRRFVNVTMTGGKRKVRRSKNPP